MSDEKSGFDGNQTAEPGGNRSLSPVVSVAVVSKAPPHKPGKPIALGFVLGSIYFFYALVSDTIAEIDVAQLLIQLTGIVGVGILASIGFKGWMGEKWSNQHRFVRASLLLSDVIQGIALCVMAFSVFSFF